MEDFDLQMEREKARLNRFIGVKELNNRNEVEKNEKLRKSIIDKEKKLKKRMDLLEKDQKMKVNDYKETLTNKLMQAQNYRRLTIQEMDQFAIDEYKKNLDSVKDRLDQQRMTEVDLSKQDFKQYLMKTSQSQPPKANKLKAPDFGAKSSVASAYYHELNAPSYSAEVEEELNVLE